jgi:putative protein-disulfide isomerase
MADQPQLIYFADPMCSWCWGFVPVVAQIRQVWGDNLPIHLVMGGLRPGTDKPVTEAAKASMREHWGHVTEASGQPFDYGFFEREGFVYDTDPAARAVVLARRYDETLALAYLVRIQGAFYAQNRDVTDFDVLADLAAEMGFHRDPFREVVCGDDVKNETWRDYATSQRAGVSGFPTLIAGPGQDGTYVALSRGWNSPETVLPMIERWLEVRLAS